MKLCVYILGQYSTASALRVCVVFEQNYTLGLHGRNSS